MGLEGLGVYAEGIEKRRVGDDVVLTGSTHSLRYRSDRDEEAVELKVVSMTAPARVFLQLCPGLVK